MHLQYVSDPSGKPTAVLIPIQEWNEILESHPDLKEAISANARTEKQRLPMSAFRGILTKERGKALQQYIEQSRKEWDRNI